MYLLEPRELDCGLKVDPSLLSVSADGDVLAVLVNPTGCSMVLAEGTPLGDAMPAKLVCPATIAEGRPSTTKEQPALRWIQSKPTAWRKERLVESIGSLEALTPPQHEKLLSFLQEHHTAFALEEHEWGETDHMEMDVDTGDAEPQRCSPRCTPFAVRDEVARQLDYMQSTGVIQPSTSRWSSPVMV